MAVLRKLTARLRPIKQDCEGFGAMELALSMPFLMLLSLGMIDASTLIAAKIDYEQAAQRTTDYALAKRPQSSSGTYLVTIAKSAAGVDASNVTVKIALECDGTVQTNFNATCASGEIPARFVGVRIQKAIPTKFDWAAMANLLGVKGFSSTVTIVGDSRVRFQ